MNEIKILCILLFAGTSLAGGWQGYSNVQGYVIEREDDGSRFYVNMTVDTNPLEDNCKNGKHPWKRIYGNTEMGKIMVSSILSAYAAKQKIQLILSGCDDWGRSVVKGIMVHD